MGNTSSDLTQAQFRKQWRLTNEANNLTIWENKQNPNQKLEQYIVRDVAAPYAEKLDQVRKVSPFLVNAYSLQPQGFACQMDNESKKLFVERMPLRLSNIQDIPYPDIIHLYDHCIHGFEQLAAIVGFFSVDQDQIGINEKGQAKVWVNNQFESNRVKGVRVTESKMVSQLLGILYQVADNQSNGKYPNLSWYISNHDNISFAQVNSKFLEYIRNYNNGEVPAALNCYYEHGGYQPIDTWCRKNNSYGYGPQNRRLSEQINQNIVNGFSIQPTNTQQYPSQTVNAQQFPIQSQVQAQPTIRNSQTFIDSPSTPAATKIDSRPFGSQELIPTSFTRPTKIEAPSSQASFIQPSSRVVISNSQATSPQLVKTTSINVPSAQTTTFSQKPAVFNSPVRFTQTQTIPQNTQYISPSHLAPPQNLQYTSPQPVVYSQPPQVLSSPTPKIQYAQAQQVQYTLPQQVQYQTSTVQVVGTQQQKPEAKIQQTAQGVRGVNTLIGQVSPKESQQVSLNKRVLQNPPSQISKNIEVKGINQSTQQVPTQNVQPILIQKSSQNEVSVQKPQGPSINQLGSQTQISFNQQSTQVVKQNIQFGSAQNTQTATFLPPQSSSSSGQVVFKAQAQPISAQQKNTFDYASSVVSQQASSPEQILTQPPQFVQSLTYSGQQQIQNRSASFNNAFNTNSTSQNQNRLQQQRVISQTIQLKQDNKLTDNVSTSNAFTIGGKNLLKGSETIDWQDFTKKNTSDTGLNNFGRSVPYSFNVDEKRTDFKPESTKFIPADDGKSSPEFLALLSQIKSGSDSSSKYIETTSNYVETPASLNKNDLISGSRKNLGFDTLKQGYSLDPISKYSTKAGQESDFGFEYSKYTTGNYLSSKYEGGIDPELHADLQKFKQ